MTFYTAVFPIVNEHTLFSFGLPYLLQSLSLSPFFKHRVFFSGVRWKGKEEKLDLINPLKYIDCASILRLSHVRFLCYDTLPRDNNITSIRIVSEMDSYCVSL